MPHPIGLDIPECLCVYLFHEGEQCASHRAARRWCGFDDDDRDISRGDVAPMRDDARAVLQNGSSRRVGVAAGVTGGHFVETKWPPSDAPIAGSPRGASAVPLRNPRVPGQSQPGPGTRRRGQHRGVHRGDQGTAQRTDVAGCHQLVVPRHGECSIASSRSKRPVSRPRLSRSIAIPRTWALSSARTERDDETRTTDTSDWRRNPAANPAAERAADGVTNEQISDSTATKEPKSPRAQEPARV